MTFAEILPTVADLAKSLIEKLFTPVISIIDQVVEDKDLKLKLKSELALKRAEMENNLALRLLEFQQKIIETAVAQNAAWHRWAVYVSGGILAVMLINNFVLLPYLADMRVMQIPGELWAVFAGLTGLTFVQQIIAKSKEGTQK